MSSDTGYNHNRAKLIKRLKKYFFDDQAIYGRHSG